MAHLLPPRTHDSTISAGKVDSNSLTTLSKAEAPTPVSTVIYNKINYQLGHSK